MKPDHFADFISRGSKVEVQKATMHKPTSLARPSRTFSGLLQRRRRWNTLVDSPRYADLLHPIMQLGLRQKSVVIYAIPRIPLARHLLEKACIEAQRSYTRVVEDT